MTVSELIEELKSHDPDAEVHFAYNYGDHWRTQVAPSVHSVEGGAVIHSSYHGMDRVADEDDEEKQDYREAVILS